MSDDRKKCWLMEGCPSRTGACYSCVPDGDECPIWRWFKKQILPKEQETIVHCEDCRFVTKYKSSIGQTICECRLTESFHKPDWFCADGRMIE